MIGFIVSVLLVFITSAIIILIVARLGLGLEVDNFGTAVVAALVIALVGFVFTWLLALLGLLSVGGMMGAILNLIVAAVVLMIGANYVAGMRVKGFGGAIIAAISISVMSFLIDWLVETILIDWIMELL